MALPLFLFLLRQSLCHPHPVSDTLPLLTISKSPKAVTKQPTSSWGFIPQLIPTLEVPGSEQQRTLLSMGHSNFFCSSHGPEAYSTFFTSWMLICSPPCHLESSLRIPALYPAGPHFNLERFAKIKSELYTHRLFFLHYSVNNTESQLLVWPLRLVFWVS